MAAFAVKMAYECHANYWAVGEETCIEERCAARAFRDLEHGPIEKGMYACQSVAAKETTGEAHRACTRESVPSKSFVLEWHTDH